MIWVALLRGVNVSGSGKLPMAEFRLMLTGLDLGRAETYIQSGNAVFDSALEAGVLEPMIREAIAARFGFAPEVFILSPDEIGAAMTDHPFANAEQSRVHVFFLRQTPVLEDEVLRALAHPGDAWHAGPRRLTLHTPGGIGQSKLAVRLMKILPAPMTARNLRSIGAVQAMVAARV